MIVLIDDWLQETLVLFFIPLASYKCLYLSIPTVKCHKTLTTSFSTSQPQDPIVRFLLEILLKILMNATKRAIFSSFPLKMALFF